MFEIGDKVYHEKLKKAGTFQGYHDFDVDTCYVKFENDEPRRVCIDNIRKVEESEG